MRKIFSLFAAILFAGFMMATTYTVAGSSDVAFGTTWAPTNTANDMTLVEGLYKWEKTGLTLAAGNILFKVCEDHAWTIAYPAQNYELNIPEAGIYTITITYNPEGNVVNGVAQKTDDAVVIPSVAMHGNFLGSWADTENFAIAEGNETASLTLTLAEGNYEFGMRIGGSGNWTSNGVAFTRENNAAEVVAGQGNLTLAADVAGEYTFTWTYADSTLVVTFPEAPVDPTEHTYTVAGNLADAFGTAWDPANEANDMVKQEDGTYKWEKAELTLAAGTISFKIVEDHAWDVAYPASDYNLNISEQGEYTITITFNPETKAVDAVATKTGDAEVTVNYYLVGSVKGWEAKAENIFTLNAEAGEGIEEYVIETTLEVGEGLKVLSSTGTWYPGGTGNEYVVDQNHAGATTIYFRPAYNEEWAAFGGYMYVVPTDPTALDEIMAAGKAVKIVRNGQILIIKGNKIFNAQGQLVK